MSEILDDDRPFSEYLDTLLTLAKLGNTDVQRITGIDNRTIQKWRKGITAPTIPLLRQFADGMEMSRTSLFIRAGILEPEDLAVDPLLLRLAEIIDMSPRDRQEVLRSHLRLLIYGTEAEAAADNASGRNGVAPRDDKKTG